MSMLCFSSPKYKQQLRKTYFQETEGTKANKQTYNWANLRILPSLKKFINAYKEKDMQIN